jgi:hypothetical protein
MTTTPGDPQSFIMIQAAKLDAKGDPLMPQLLLGDPCKDCKAINNYLCTHQTDSGPFWKSTTNRSAFSFFYEDDKEVDAAENYNAQFNTTNYGFRPEYVKWLRDAPRWQDDSAPGILVMGADAAGGGQDEFAITILYVGRGGVHVVSILVSFFFDFIHVTLRVPPSPI